MQIEICHATCANATLDWINIFVDPLKTSEISKLLKNKIYKPMINYIRQSFGFKKFNTTAIIIMVEPGGIEPPTSCVQGRRSPSWAMAPWLTIFHLKIYLVGLGRFELPTSPLSGVRSNQLSYRPKDISWCLVALRAKLGHNPGLLLISDNLWGYSHPYFTLTFFLLFKGGDPAARSRTATLLRLHPSHWPHRGKRPPEG